MGGPDGRRPAHHTVDVPIYTDDVCLCGALIQRTVSFLWVGALAGVLLLELLARQYSRIFRETRRLQREGCPPDPGTALRLRKEARAITLGEWKRQLTAAAESEGPGRSIVDAILPCFEEWISKGRLAVSFRVTQVLSGHGVSKSTCVASEESAPHSATTARPVVTRRCTRWRFVQRGRKSVVS
jgi:hypothetical protein